MKISGQDGAVKWGYQPAVSFLTWMFEGNHEGGTLTAQIAHADEFVMTQSPLVVVVPLGDRTVRWPVCSLITTGSTARVVCGPRERTA